MDFKVGDRVKVLSGNKHYHNYISMKVGIISSLTSIVGVVYIMNDDIKRNILTQ